MCVCVCVLAIWSDLRLRLRRVRRAKEKEKERRKCVVIVRQVPFSDISNFAGAATLSEINRPLVFRLYARDAREFEFLSG